MRGERRGGASLEGTVRVPSGQEQLPLGGQVHRAPDDG